MKKNGLIDTFLRIIVEVWFSINRILYGSFWKIDKNLDYREKVKAGLDYLLMYLLFLIAFYLISLLIDFFK